MFLAVYLRLDVRTMSKDEGLKSLHDLIVTDKG